MQPERDIDQNRLLEIACEAFPRADRGVLSGFVDMFSRLLNRGIRVDDGSITDQTEELTGLQRETTP